MGVHDNTHLRNFLHSLPQEEIGLLINRFTHGKKKIFRSLSLPVQRQVVWDLNQYSRKYILTGLKTEELKQILEDMDSDDAADIVYILPEHRRPEILKTLTKEDSQNISALLQYPEYTAGHLMQKELIKVPEYFSVFDTIKRVERFRTEVKDIQYIFVTDSKGRLLGVVPITQLILHPPRTKIKTLVEQITSVPVTMDQEEVAHIFKEQDLNALPVVDEEGRLIGRITADDVVDVLEQEQSEDMYQMAGVSTDEHIFDPPLHSVKKRFFWLTINLATAFLAAFVVSLFEGTIERFAILAAYMPIVAGMGGNAATQTITIVVRSMALHEVQFKDAWKVLWKEIVIGVVNGVLLGILTGVVSYYFNGFFMLGVVIGLAMIVNLVIAGLSGTLIPLMLKSLRLDPALASSVFVTTCTDVGGFLAFLGLATVLL